MTHISRVKPNWKYSLQSYLSFKPCHYWLLCHCLLSPIRHCSKTYFAVHTCDLICRITVRGFYNNEAQRANYLSNLVLIDLQRSSGHDVHLLFLCPATCHCAACRWTTSLASLHPTTFSSTTLIALPTDFTSISLVDYTWAHCSRVTTHVHLNTVTAVIPLVGLRPVRCSTQTQTQWLLPQPTMLLPNSGSHSCAREASELRATCEYGELIVQHASIPVQHNIATSFCLKNDCLML